MNTDPKAWARRLVAEYEADRPPKPTNVYRVAYAALGLTFPEGGPTNRPGNVQETAKNVQKCSGVVRSVARTPVPVPKRAPISDPWWDSTDRSEERA